MKEVWKDIKGYEGQYIVSNMGNVRSLDRYVSNKTGVKLAVGQSLKQHKDRFGYMRVALCQPTFHKLCLAHRLVAEAFIPNPEKKPQVNHINGIKTDNRVDNLEWATASENTRHAHEKLGHRSGRLGKKGKDCSISKIVLQIKDGKVIAEFYGTREAERKTGIFSSQISPACRGKCKTAGGYEWKYKE